MKNEVVVITGASAGLGRATAREFGKHGAKVALICALIEAAGLALIAVVPWFALALTGAALAGLGYSLVYPGFGVEYWSVPPKSGCAGPPGRNE